NMDGDGHVQFKRALMKIFTRDYVNRCIEIAGKGLLAQLHEQLLSGQKVELVDFTRQFTTNIMLYMFGVDIERINLEAIEPMITDAVMNYMSKLHLTKIELTEKERLSVFERVGKVDAFIDSHQRADQSDSLLCAVREMGLSPAEARGLMYSLLVAGTETTNVTIPRVLALLLDSGQYQVLKAHPHLMSNTLE